MAGLIVLIIFGGVFLFGILALIFGFVSLSRINRSKGQLRGRGLAITAIIIGFLFVLGFPLLAGASFFFLSASAPSEPIVTRSSVHFETHSPKPAVGTWEPVETSSDTGAIATDPLPETEPAPAEPAPAEDMEESD